MDTITRAALRFAACWSEGMLPHHIGPALTCDEAEAVADVLCSVGFHEHAARFIAGHAEADEPGDLHHPEH